MMNGCLIERENITSNAKNYHLKGRSYGLSLKLQQM